MSDPTTPAAPDQPSPYASGGSGQPEPSAPPTDYGQPSPYGQPAPGGYPPAGQGGGYPPAGQPGYPPPGQAAGYPPPGSVAPASQSDERTWAMLGHLGGIVIGFIAGLIVYLVYKDRSQYLKEQGAEALNFQITIVIGYIAFGIISTILAFVTFGLGIFLYFIPGILQLVFGIIAGIAANKHENYRYPFAIRLIK